MSKKRNIINTAQPLDTIEDGVDKIEKDASVNSPKQKFWFYLWLSIAFFTVLVVTLIMCLVFRADYKPLNAEHNARVNMIKTAKNLEKLNGVITGETKLDKETNRYAFEYRVESSDAGGSLTAFSPCVYTLTEIEDKYVAGSDCLIIVDLEGNGGRLDDNAKSVNADYIDFNIMSYAPYKKAFTGYVIFLIATTVCAFIAFCFFGFSMVALHASKKNENTKSDEEMDAVEVVKPNGTRAKK